MPDPLSPPCRLINCPSNLGQLSLTPLALTSIKNWHPIIGEPTSPMLSWTACCTTVTKSNWKENPSEKPRS